MTTKVNGCAALLLTTGLLFGLAGLSPRAADAASAKPLNSSGLPASVADANAQWPAPTTTTGNAKGAPTRDLNVPQAVFGAPPAMAPAGGIPAVAPDQLSDADRALRDTPPAAAPAPVAPPVAVADASPVAASPAASADSNDSSTWDKTSLIGKIFVGCGALLTMASAARMFMA